MQQLFTAPDYSHAGSSRPSARPLAALLTLCGLVWIGSASNAAAQTSANHISGVRPEVHVGLGGHGDLGAGFRVDIPIVPDGFISGADDEFALSPGLDIQFVNFNHHENDDDVLFIPQLAAQWNFYFPRGWSIFPELGAAFVIGSRHRGGSHHRGDDFHIDALVAFGARYHFSARNALVMRLGFPSGFQIGISF